ncbi:PREDICTED: protein deglycase DJ-1zDJ-1 [Drosophila arizonae]|uniref:Protein deglycase DJ-1zDJ-1 n=1 Tax=Drosophila arizonae TaxID=7263 RepID=A0ABM1PCL9_DROAR|nr:PREDICTED: protein deglycase DJ-1zDJ-1 [Drosophila arizonae]
MYSMLRWPLRLLTLGRSRENSALSIAIQQPKGTYINKMDGKRALIVLAPGAEEMEFTIAADVLRRAGIIVTVAGLEGSEPVKCSRDVMIVPDKSLEDAVTDQVYDVIVLPGGLGGSTAMSNSKAVGELLHKQESAGRLIAAICAAPTALAKHGIATGKSLTSYPAMKPQLVEKYCYVDDQNVVQDGNLITSRGPGTAYEFALKISEQLAGTAKAQEIAKAMLLSYN